MKKINKSNIIVIAMILTFMLLTIIVVFMQIYHPYPLKYQDEIIYASKKYGVSSSLVASVINVESSYNPNAKSYKGATGLMQLMPSTAEWLCQKIGKVYYENLLTDPIYNIELGTYYLSYLKNKFTYTNTILASYNAGEGNVKLWLLNDDYSKDGKTLNNTPYEETNNYIKKVNLAQKYYLKKYLS